MNSNNFLLSVLMITYNHEKYIAQAIESALMQKTNFDYEIVIGEDCSTDKTREIVLNYKEKYPDKIKLILQKENVGMIQNFIDTMKACSGKYIALLEGDDYWTDPYKLQKQVDFLELNTEYGLIHTDSNRLFEDTKRIEKDFNKKNSIYFPSGDIFDKLLKDFYFIVTATVVVRRELLLLAFNPELFTERKWKLGDLPIWLEIAANSKIKYFDENTATYRLNDESASRTKDLIKHHDFHKSVYDIRYYFWEKYSKNPVVKRIVDSHYFDMLIGDAYKMKRLEIAKKAIKEIKLKGYSLTLKQRIKYFVLLFYNLFEVNNIE